MTIRARQQLLVPSPPSTITGPLRQWMVEVVDALNGLPPMSTFSYPTPEGNVPAVPGTLGSNLADGTLWQKQTGSSTTGWVSLATN